MKTNFTYVVIIRIILFILICLYSFLVFGQPDYNCQGAIHKSGTALLVNTKNRFNNVRPGIPAKVTIAAITGGLTLSATDNAGSGFKEAFQPVINVPAHSNGYVEFKIDFVTTCSAKDLPAIQLDVPTTPIDVDGNTITGGKVFEYDMIKRASQQQGSFEVLDYSGGVVFQQPQQGENNILIRDLEKLPSGIYMTSIRTT